MILSQQLQVIEGDGNQLLVVRSRREYGTIVVLHLIDQVVLVFLFVQFVTLGQELFLVEGNGGVFLPLQVLGDLFFTLVK